MIWFWHLSCSLRLWSTSLLMRSQLTSSLRPGMLICATWWKGPSMQSRSLKNPAFQNRLQPNSTSMWSSLNRLFTWLSIFAWTRRPQPQKSTFHSLSQRQRLNRLWLLEAKCFSSSSGSRTHALQTRLLGLNVRSLKNSYQHLLNWSLTLGATSSKTRPPQMAWLSSKLGLSLSKKVLLPSQARPHILMMKNTPSMECSMASISSLAWLTSRHFSP